MSIQQQAQQLLDEATSSLPGLGLQFCAFQDGKCVASAFSGDAAFDGSKKVDEHTLFPIYSTSKSVPATALVRLVWQGKISLDQPVTDFWSEFGKNGKENTRVLHLLNHTSGVPQRLREQTSYEAIADWDTMIHAIENVACDWTPGTKTRYQSLSYGWLTAELIQRITKTSFIDYIKTELGFDRNSDFIFGLDDETEKRTSDFKLANEKKKSSSFSKCDPLDDLMKNDLIRRMVQPGFNGFASAYGLAVFLNDVVNCKFFDREHLELATSTGFRPEKETPVCNNTMFGLGYAICGPVDDPGLFFGHGGYGGTEVTANRDTGTVCAFTTNILDGAEDVKAKLYALMGMKQRDGWERP